MVRSSGVGSCFGWEDPRRIDWPLAAGDYRSTIFPARIDINAHCLLYVAHVNVKWGGSIEIGSNELNENHDSEAGEDALGKDESLS